MRQSKAVRNIDQDCLRLTLADLFDLPPEPSSPSALPGWYKDDQNVTDFGPTPLHDDVRVLACPDCKRPVLQEAFGFHQSR